MISEFSQLSQKIGQLAELTVSLRRENAELRQYAVSLGAENAELHRRMQQAHERVAAVIARLPVEPAEDTIEPVTEEHDAEASA
jgi:cell division protein ZapB